jgi:hypothetical protein
MLVLEIIKNVAKFKKEQSKVILVVKFGRIMRL